MHNTRLMVLPWYVILHTLPPHICSYHLLKHYNVQLWVLYNLSKFYRLSVSVKHIRSLTIVIPKFIFKQNQNRQQNALFNKF